MVKKGTIMGIKPIDDENEEDEDGMDPKKISIY